MKPSVKFYESFENSKGKERFSVESELNLESPRLEDIEI